MEILYSCAFLVPSSCCCALSLHNIFAINSLVISSFTYLVKKSEYSVS